MAEKAEKAGLSVSSYDGQGAPSGEVELPESVFGQTPHMAVMHQAYLRQLANARQGTAATKTRADVRGGGGQPAGEGRPPGPVPRWGEGGQSHTGRRARGAPATGPSGSPRWSVAEPS